MAIKLMVASYNNGAADWNAEAEETNFLSYGLDHQFNAPAVARIRIADKSGSMAQKYGVAANDVYIGVGKVTIEEPVGTDVFYGRIVKAEHDSKNSVLILTCRDWLDQLNDEVVDYDMRVDLDGAGLRQSELHADPDSTIFVGSAYSGAVAIGAFLNYDHGTTTYTDDTTDANDAGADDVTMLPITPEVNDAAVFGFDNIVDGMRLNIGTAATGTYTLTWYYSTGAGTWTAITVTDGTNNFKTAGTNDVTWTPPAAWATATYATLSKYWIKAQITAFTSMVRPAGTQFWTLVKNVFDDDMAWANDALNGKYLLLTAGMAGDITVGTGPYQATAVTVDTGDGDPNDVWVDDNTSAVFFSNNNYSMQYDFRVYVGHNTPSDLYRHDSLTSVRVVCTYQFNDGGTGAAAILEIYDNTAEGWVKLADLTNDNTTYYNITITPPGYLLTRVVDADGIVKLRFSVTDDAWGANATISLDYLWVEVKVSCIGYTAPILIRDTVTTNRLFIDTDLYTAATQKVWEGIPYSVAAKIYTHINTIVQAGDAQVTLTTNVEATSGISINHFERKTRLDALQELAEEDGALFWLILGGTVVQWLKTTDASSTALTDAGVLRWIPAGYDFDRVYNKYIVRGIRIGTGQVEGTDSDATSIAKYRTTRSRVLSLRALSDAQATDMAEALVDRDTDPKLNLQAEIGGLSSIRLGDYIAVTSTYLNLTAVAYTVVGWSYDSRAYKTTITLEPRGTVGHQLQPQSIHVAVQQAQARERQERGDRYLPDLTTHVVT